MNTNLTTLATNSIISSQYKVANAAQEIASFPVKKEEVGSKEFRSDDLIKPLLSLREAELETSAAIKILQVDKDTKGSLFKAIA